MLSASPLVASDPDFTFGPVMTAVSDFKALLQEVCQNGCVSIYERGRYKDLYHILILCTINDSVDCLLTLFYFFIFYSEKYSNCKESRSRSRV